MSTPITSRTTRRILVTGARGYTDSEQVTLALQAAMNILATATGQVLPRDHHHVVHGNAPGLDRLAETMATGLGMRYERHHADWDTHGRRAGFLRNEKMVAAEADIALAFPMHPRPAQGKATSRGTWLCVTSARKAGIPTLILWRGQLFPHEGDHDAALLLV